MQGNFSVHSSTLKGWAGFIHDELVGMTCDQLSRMNYLFLITENFCLHEICTKSDITVA